MGNIFGTLWNTLLFYPFLNTLLVIYHVTGDNLGWAVIIVAIILRLILIPFSKQQMDMMKKMSDLRPRLDEINKKYKHNQEKLSKEQMKLYKEVGYNPLGCFVSFLPQILILIAMVEVINVVTANSLNGVYSFVHAFVVGNNQNFTINTHFLWWNLSDTYVKISKDHGYFATQGVAYILLAVLVGLIQYYSTKFMQLMQGPAASTITKKSDKDEPLSPEEMQAQMSKSMNTMFPIMTGVMALSTPAVLGVYWFIQSLMLIVQYFFMDYKKSWEMLKKTFEIDLNNPFKKS